MRTLAGNATAEVEIRRSRFIAHAARVDKLQQTLDFYEAVADPDATHNCWAWKLDQQYRFNDDGEPGGSAGRPILGAIEGKGLDHTMVVVTRYFGGTKLGVGGLVRAYSGTAAKALDAAGVVTIAPTVHVRIDAGFEHTGQVYAALESCGAKKRDEAFGSAGVTIDAVITAADLDRLRALLSDTTRGNATVNTVP